MTAGLLQFTQNVQATWTQCCQVKKDEYISHHCEQLRGEDQ